MTYHPFNSIRNMRETWGVAVVSEESRSPEGVALFHVKQGILNEMRLTYSTSLDVSIEHKSHPQ